MRLDALLSSSLGIKTAAARIFIEAGDVTVHGKIQREPRWQIVLGEEHAIVVGGEPLRAVGRTPFAHYILLVHKPRAVHCAKFADAAGGRRSLWDLVPPDLSHATLGAFGRLDADTTGLILMGTDGGLQSLLMHPSCGCEKAYVATLRVSANFRLRANAIAEFAAGVPLANGYTCRAARLEILETVAAPAGDANAAPFPYRVRVTIVEGQNHQVKKMLGAVGASVDYLHRERIGSIRLSDYPQLSEPGSVYRAGPHEEELLRSMLPAHRVAEHAASDAAGPSEAMVAPPPPRLSTGRLYEQLHVSIPDPSSSSWPSPNTCAWPTSEQAALLVEIMRSRGLSSLVSIGCGEGAFEACVESCSDGSISVQGVDLDVLSDTSSYKTMRSFLSSGISRVRPDEIYSISDPQQTCICFVWGRKLPWRQYLQHYLDVPLVCLVGEPVAAGESHDGVATDPSGNALDGDSMWDLVHQGKARAVHGGAVMSVYERRTTARLRGGGEEEVEEDIDNEVSASETSSHNEAMASAEEAELPIVSTPPPRQQQQQEQTPEWLTEAEGLLDDEPSTAGGADLDLLAGLAAVRSAAQVYGESLQTLVTAESDFVDDLIHEEPTFAAERRAELRLSTETPKSRKEEEEHRVMMLVSTLPSFNLWSKRVAEARHLQIGLVWWSHAIVEGAVRAWAQYARHWRVLGAAVREMLSASVGRAFDIWRLRTCDGRTVRFGEIAGLGFLMTHCWRRWVGYLTPRRVSILDQVGMAVYSYSREHALRVGLKQWTFGAMRAHIDVILMRRVWELPRSRALRVWHARTQRMKAAFADRQSGLRAINFALSDRQYGHKAIDVVKAMHRWRRLGARKPIELLAAERAGINTIALGFDRWQSWLIAVTGGTSSRGRIRRTAAMRRAAEANAGPYAIMTAQRTAWRRWAITSLHLRYERSLSERYWWGLQRLVDAMARWAELCARRAADARMTSLASSVARAPRLFRAWVLLSTNGKAYRLTLTGTPFGKTPRWRDGKTYRMASSHAVAMLRKRHLAIAFHRWVMIENVKWPLHQQLLRCFELATALLLRFRWREWADDCRMQRANWLLSETLPIVHALHRWRRRTAEATVEELVLLRGITLPLTHCLHRWRIATEDRVRIAQLVNSSAQIPQRRAIGLLHVNAKQRATSARLHAELAKRPRVTRLRPAMEHWFAYCIHQKETKQLLDIAKARASRNYLIEAYAFMRVRYKWIAKLRRADKNRLVRAKERALRCWRASRLKAVAKRARAAARITVREGIAAAERARAFVRWAQWYRMNAAHRAFSRRDRLVAWWNKLQRGWEALCLAAVEDNVRIQGIRNLMDRRAAWALARWCSHCRLCSVGTLSSLAWRLRATGAALRLWTSYVANLMPDCTATIRAFRNQRRRVELLRTLARMASALAHADGQANAREMAEGYHERKMLREGMTLWRRDVQRRTELLFLGSVSGSGVNSSSRSKGPPRPRYSIAELRSAGIPSGAPPPTSISNTPRLSEPQHHLAPSRLETRLPVYTTPPVVTSGLPEELYAKESPMRYGQPVAPTSVRALRESCSTNSMLPLTASYASRLSRQPPAGEEEDNSARTNAGGVGRPRLPAHRPPRPAAARPATPGTAAPPTRVSDALLRRAVRGAASMGVIASETVSESRPGRASEGRPAFLKDAWRKSIM